ncbi:signal peptidase I [Bacilli bacterium]|nr:signal peptidase [Bacilli bacterium VT-13-104]MBU8791703.1 signal peptidase I [Oceanobacillus caeni]PZD83600.1 signal peptidase I [Bacilli bacterium]PZD85666.1 signal peptidase I [Bacilli bacterium]PZD88870.1 signal peptidase I [Bacilli bacterium]
MYVLKNKSKKQKNEWIEWLKAIVIAIIIAFFLRTFIFATSIVEGESMDPTLEDGERVIFNKLIYLIDEPSRGDIVIIQRPTKNYVKRVIGLPGETIEINEGELYINGERYNQTFLSEEARLQTNNFGPETIPEDSYFVMGDNRAISKDSRNGLGLIQESEIIGKSEIIIYPFSEWKRTR